jgi:hypothetical protein
MVEIYNTSAPLCSDDLCDTMGKLSFETKKNKPFESTFIYVISNSVYSGQNMYKIGKHTGSKKSLIKRYKTYLIDPVVYLLFPTGTSSSDESSILSRLLNYRVGTSEFVKLDLETILDTIENFYSEKYKRIPCVKLEYTKSLVSGMLITDSRVVLDFQEKTIQNKKCSFFPNLKIHDHNQNCLDTVTIVWENKQLFELKIRLIQTLFEYLQDKQSLLVDFMHCFFIRFEKKNSYLYLNEFSEDGWSMFLVHTMKVLYSHHRYSVISRKELLKKESFHERVIFVKKDETPLDLVLTKAQQIQTCLVIEDKNIYSIHETEIGQNLINDLIYYFFYIF